MRIPLSRPRITSKEREYVLKALNSGDISGDGKFSQKCHLLLGKDTGCEHALLTHSCTAALEMAGLLIDLQPGDEVIMPSYAFVSTATAVTLRGAMPVFVDIREDTFNLDEKLIEPAVTDRTKAIFVVHYAGVASDMEPIMTIAREHNLFVVEDAAQAYKATYNGQALGTIGDYGALSFHVTKNIQSGEGGALLINNHENIERAEILREKGTNRRAFLAGEVDKYTWVDHGSSYLPSDLIAACLLAQLEDAEEITAARLKIWNRYHELLTPETKSGNFRCPIIPDYASHNAHMYPILLENSEVRNKVQADLCRKSIQATFHYIPLHSSPAGLRYGRAAGQMDVTDNVAARILRLPLYPNLSTDEQSKVVELLLDSMP